MRTIIARYHDETRAQFRLCAATRALRSAVVTTCVRARACAYASQAGVGGRMVVHRFSNWSTSVALLMRALLETLYIYIYRAIISAGRLSIRAGKVKRGADDFPNGAIVTKPVTL